MARFEAYEVALELAAALGPVLTAIARHDAALGSQARRTTSSVVLCLAEGARRNGKDRLHLYRVAAGSAAEVRAALALALARAWGFAGPGLMGSSEVLLDRILAMLWRLTHQSPPLGTGGGEAGKLDPIVRKSRIEDV